MIKKKWDFGAKTEKTTDPPILKSIFMGQNPHFLNPQSPKLTRFGRIIMDIIYKLIN